MMKKIFFKTIWTLLLAGFILTMSMLYFLYDFSKTQLNVTGDAQFFTLNQGSSAKWLAKQLERQNLLDNAFLLPYLYKLDPTLGSIKAGTYQLTPKMTVTDLLQLLVSGKEYQFAVRLVEGKTSHEWLELLKNSPYITPTLAGKSDAEIAEQLGISGSIEGWLSPNTYQYTANTTDIAILKRAHVTLKSYLETVWQERDPDLPYKNPYEMLIMASIIEKETSISAERTKVASVFINRLKYKMRLQTDPTIIYGLGKNYTGNIRRSDIADKKNSYNTYVINGLPPTPIAMPSLESINAAAHPDKTNYLYFVANGEGGHTFTTSYKDHQKAVSVYRKLMSRQIP